MGISPPYLSSGMKRHRRKRARNDTGNGTAVGISRLVTSSFCGEDPEKEL